MGLYIDRSLIQREKKQQNRGCSKAGLDSSRGKGMREWHRGRSVGLWTDIAGNQLIALT